MSGRNWKNDPFYQKAKKEGYRARSAYKLIHIDEAFNVFKKGRYWATNILDLGCHPGSFIQYILEKYDELLSEGKINHFYVLGIDKTSIKDFERQEVEFYRGDIFKQDVEEFIKERGKFDLILSDLAPKTAGDYRDVAIQEEMVQRVFQFFRYLNTHGNCVIKVFESAETQKIIKIFKKKFRIVKITKPKASRSKSREKFLVCKDYL